MTQKNHGITTPLEGVPAKPWDPNAPIAAPLSLHFPTVLPAWVDYNGHMSESCYLLVFGDNSDAFFRFIGIDESYRDRGGHSLYTVETHIHHVQEVAQGEPLRLNLQLIDHDAKRVHIFHTMTHDATGDVLATAEQMLVHVDMAQGRSADMPADLQDRLNAIAKAHAVLAAPKNLGKPMGIRRKAL